MGGRWARKIHGPALPNCWRSYIRRTIRYDRLNQFLYATSFDRSLVIQFAKLSGYSPIITTASVKNTEYLKSLGATHVLDRNVPVSSLPAAIQKITSKRLLLVYDTVSSEETQNAGYDLLVPGGTLVTVLQPTVAAGKITTDKRVTCIRGSPFFPDRRALAVAMWKELPGMFERGDLQVSPSRDLAVI